METEFFTMSTYDDDLIGLTVLSDTVKQCIAPPQSYTDQFESECFRILRAIGVERKKIERLGRVDAILMADKRTGSEDPALPLIVKSCHKKKAD